MLILINNEVFDVGDPVATLKALGVEDLASPPSASRLVRLGQDAAFTAKGLENAHPGIRQTLAAFFGFAGEANCGLFLVPPKARSAREVQVRLGAAPITTLAHLKSTQDVGKLTAKMINHHVWAGVQGASAA